MPSKIFKRKDDLVQGSTEWHKWRSTIIGASDAPVIMRESPWKTRESLLKEKTGEKAGFKGNPTTRRGNQLEPIARSIYQKLKTIEVSPALIQSMDRPFGRPQPKSYVDREDSGFLAMHHQN